MESVSLQIQTVLYHNRIESLLKSLDSVKRAVEINREKGPALREIRLCYGDSSPSPLLSEPLADEIKKRYQNYFEFGYRFFNGNMGTARGQNLLAEGAFPDYIFIINPDVIFAPDLFRELFRPFEKRRDIGIVEARQLPFEHPKNYDKHTGDTSWASGACTLIRGGLFHSVGGYDADSFFLYCDDVDLSWRVRLKGFRVVYQPSAMVFHDKRLTADGKPETSASERYFSAEAALLMAHKWSNKARVKRLLSFFCRSENETLLRAAREFEKRKAEGRLPEPVAGAHRVAEFAGDTYGGHRFAL